MSSLYQLGAAAPLATVPVKVVSDRFRLGDVIVGVCTGVASSLIVHLLVKGRK